jgi:predicted PurR-regulated permease PerM
MLESRRLYLEPVAALAVLAFVFFACIKIIFPFLGPILWSVIIVVATWPLYVKLKNLLGTRTKLATALMTIALALILVGPVAVLTVSLTEQIGNATHVFRDLADAELSETPPAWVGKVPVAGAWIEKIWHEAATDMQGFVAKIRPQIRTAAAWLLAQGAQLGLVLLQFLLVILISALLYPNGETLGRYARAFSVRLGGGSGNQLP